MKIKNLENFIPKPKIHYDSSDLSSYIPSLAEIFDGTAVDIAPRLERPTDEFIKAAEELYRRHQEENRAIFRAAIPKCNHEIAEKLLELPEYNESLLPFFIDIKPAELEYLYSIASKKDLTGELRIPACTFPYFARIPTEKLKSLTPIMMSKNDMGLWNFGPTYIMTLDKYNSKQIELMTKLADAKVSGRCIQHVITNPHLNWEKTVEKAQTLKKIYGKDLREINFFSNRKGENYLSADIQLPHRDDKPDWQNFKVVYSKLDDDVNAASKIKNDEKIVKLVDNIYEKIEKKLCLFTAKDLYNSVKNILAQHPDVEHLEVLTIMQKLTQFSNYSSLKPLAEQLKKQNITEIYPYGSIGNSFSYFHRHKGLFKLGDALDLKNDTYAYLITKKDLQDTELGHDLQTRLQSKSFRERVKLINPEGWSDGVNIFADDKTLEEKTLKIIRKVKKVMAKNPNLTFEEATSKVLNYGIEKTIKSWGGEVTTIKLDAPPAIATILDQMKPIMPTKSILHSAIDTIAKENAPSKKEFKKLSKNIAQYVEENHNIYTKQSIIENLKKIHTEIEKFMAEKNLPKENLYFIQPYTPDEVKSFEIITKMYQELYNIPEEKIAAITEVYDLNLLPPNSTCVILDDIVGTGQSMTDIGQYILKAGGIHKDKHILFVPITGTKNGLAHINKNIKDFGREDIDKVICLPENITNNRSEKNKLLKFYFSFDKNGQKAYGDEGWGENGSCTAFPYMSPDNNSELGSNLINFFVPDYKCIKNKSNNISKIEENIYIYDVFGTDKQHISTDGKKAFAIGYNGPSIFDSIKRIFNFD